MFQIDPDSNTVELIETEVSRDEVLEEIYRLPSIFPEHRLTLRTMLPTEYPVDERSYELALDSFDGDDAFLRVLGPPVWVNWIQDVICTCGLKTMYIASVGSEGSNGRRVLSDRNFFYGEGCLYFFFCEECLILAVISQGT